MTPWEKEILKVLSWHVRVLSMAQLVRVWWRKLATGKRLANDCINARAANGWLHVREVISRPSSPLDGPIETWNPNEPTPDFDELSRLLHRRSRTPARKLKIVIATRKCRELFGVSGAAHRPKLAQLSHELFVGEVFLHYLDSGMDTDREWVGEDQFPKPWPIRSRPDALICNQDGEYIRAVEYGGAYSVQRLSTLHNALKSISMPYEVW